MPIVLRIDGLVVVIYLNYHTPAHVHVRGAGLETLFYLGCPDGTVILRENFGFNGTVLKQIDQALTRHLKQLCATWREFLAATENIAAANARAAERRATTPYATAARYDRKSDRIVLTLSSKVELMFSPRDAQGLEEATPAQLATIEISPSGFGIHFPNWMQTCTTRNCWRVRSAPGKRMAARLSAVGDSSRSKLKAAASRANGSLGGRPRKAAATRSVLP